MQAKILFALFVVGVVHFAVPQTIDPGSVDEATKGKTKMLHHIVDAMTELHVEKWCTDQKSSCPLLCLQIPGATETPDSNNCTASTLVYSCVCSNGQQPNASQYSQTIPYYECTEAATQCVNNCAQGDSSCQSACRTDHPCGAQAPIRVNTSTISTMSATPTTDQSSASTADSTNTYTGFGGSSTNSAKSGAGERAQTLAVGFGRTYGLAMVLVGLSGGFIFML